MSDESLASELRVSVGRASRRIRAERGEAGLPDNQFSVLLWIEKRGPLTPGQLAELERIQPPSMTRTVNWGSVSPWAPRSARIRRAAWPTAMRSSPARAGAVGMMVSLTHYLT